jgi:hypothetical protein
MKKRTEAYRYLKLHRMGTHIPLAGQRETQAAQSSFRIYCTEIHRWALNNLLETRIQAYFTKEYNLCAREIKRISHRRIIPAFLPMGKAFDA